MHIADNVFTHSKPFAGLDFAIYRNGYIYHTKHDTPDLIPASTFQNTGDNILALTIAVANSDELGLGYEAHVSFNNF